MVGFKWGRGGTLRAHISKRGKCRSFFNIKAKQPRKRHHFSTLHQKTQAISYILNAAKGGRTDRAAAVKFQAARCDITIRAVQKWMREFNAGSITVRKPTAGRPSKCTVQEQTRIEALLEANNYKMTYSALAKVSKVPTSTLKRWAHKWGWEEKRTTPRPMLTSANIQKRLQWAEKYRNKKFNKWVDVDEKWVSCYKAMGKFKMPRGKKCPQPRRKNAKHELKVMFITAIARNSITTGHNGAIRIDPVGHYRPAKIGNKKLGLLKGRKLFVPDSANAKLYAKILRKKIVPAIRKRWPTAASVVLQMDNASAHVSAMKLRKLQKLCNNTRRGTRARIILLLQPANSPDTNANDAAFYRSLEYVLGETRQQKPIELIKEVRAAFKNYDAATMGRVFDVKALNIQAILAAAGNNDYKRPHHRDFLSARAH